MTGDQWPTIAVTGATGRLGGRVARILAERGIAQRLAVRQPDAAGGVDRVVYVFFFGASPTATFTLARDHWATEEHLRASELASVNLRDNFYLDFLPELVEADGVIRGPAGDGRVAAVAQDDIAEAAAAILADPAPHDVATYSLTGPDAITLGEAAAIIARRTDRPVSYQDQTSEEAYASRAAPAWQVDAWVSTYTAIAHGELDGVTADIPLLTGHPARSLDDLLAE